MDRFDHRILYGRVFILMVGIDRGCEGIARLTMPGNFFSTCGFDRFGYGNRGIGGEEIVYEKQAKSKQAQAEKCKKDAAAVSALIFGATHDD